jgi:hypothetical protein
MSWSYIPRWKFTDSCGRPRMPGGIHVGCSHDGHTHSNATPRALLKAGVAVVGGAEGHLRTHAPQ